MWVADVGGGTRGDWARKEVELELGFLNGCRKEARPSQWHHRRFLFLANRGQLRRHQEPPLGHLGSLLPQLR